MKAWWTVLPALVLIASCVNPLTPLGLAYAGTQALPFMGHLAGNVMASHDGQRVAYTEEGRLFAFDVNLPQPKKLADSAAPVAWMADGKHLVLQMTTPLPVPSLAPGQAKPRFQPMAPVSALVAMDVTTGESRPLTLTSRGGIQVKAAPDGRQLAIVRNEGEGEAGIYLHDVATQQETLLKAGTHSRQWAWSPDSKHVAIMTYGDAPTIMIVAADSRAAVAITDIGPDAGPWKVEAGCWPAEDKFFWAPDSQSITAVLRRTPHQLALRSFGLDGALLGERLVDTADASDTRRLVDCYRPSPDGRYVVGLKDSTGGSMADRPFSLISISLDSGKRTDVAPPSTFIAWLGNTGRFVYQNNEWPGGNRFFIGDATQAR